jgi:hypothetical protein
VLGSILPEFVIQKQLKFGIWDLSTENQLEEIKPKKKQLTEAQMDMIWKFREWEKVKGGIL